MLLAEVAATSDAVAATRSRLAKRAAIADLLVRAAHPEPSSPPDGRPCPPDGRPCPPVPSGVPDDTGPHGRRDDVGTDPGDDVEIVVAYLGGELRQRRTGLGWASLRDLPPPAPEPTLTVRDVDAAFALMAGLSGPGSDGERAAAAAALFGAATAREQALLAGLVGGELRQGALDAVVIDAVAQATGTPADAVRRAVMLAGATGPVARAALLADGTEAARAALAAFTLRVGRPVRPMLAASAPDVAGALTTLGAGTAPGDDDAADGDAADVGPAEGVPVAVDVKLDGIRVQVHRDGDAVRVWSRSLDELTARVPGVVAAARALPASRFVLDGEALVVGSDGVPRPFQETASRSATRTPAGTAPEGDGTGGLDAAVELRPFFFDVLHVDGRDLLDEPLRERLRALDALTGGAPEAGDVPRAADVVVPRLVTADPGAAQAFFDDAVARGQEGVVVKALDAPYAAGRRGAGWVKVKPRHTLDLVVLAVERGSGRRQGWLSNIHLGARDPDGGFVMLGKTFKGMTDAMLAWQTERFLELADGPTDGSVVRVRPEQVVEIAFDGLQRSTRYPGGLALRFARVLRYRDDKTAAEADTIDAVRALAGR